jgi:hypothetical protein
VITITGIGDHLRPEWPITITGTRNRELERRPLLGNAMRPARRTVPERLLTDLSPDFGDSADQYIVSRTRQVIGKPQVKPRGGKR